MKKIYYYILSMFIAVVAFACSDENTDGSFHRVEVAYSNVTFTSVGGSGEIVIKTPNVKATSNESWCQISTSGTKVSVTVEPNLSLEERTAVVYMTADGMADFQIPVSQSGVKMKVIGMRVLDGIGETDVEFAYEADFPMDMVEIEDDWLQATIEGDRLSLTASMSDDRTNTRSTIVWFAPRGQTALRIPLAITQSKRPKYLLPLEYGDYLGEYELAYSITYNNTARTKTTRVRLVEGDEENTYYLKGILKDESIGNIVMQYVPGEGVITITAQKICTQIPSDPTKDAWILTYYSSANTVSVSTSNSLASGNFNLLDGLVFDMKHYTSSSSTIVIGGFTLRTYPTGVSSGNSAWSAGAANGDVNYCHSQFKKIE
ncbi:BACON domain-containing protein [Bacteroides sp. UBA939]|uniref:BACON domain-containing protein n=1 Tax=Bacteroides sp. UBA939 TaxID=1946092 RepID=UPI0025C5339E|nr:BACON domain-containing protein [Bacteroides sp. UBA939]